MTDLDSAHPRAQGFNFLRLPRDTTQITLLTVPSQELLLKPDFKSVACLKIQFLTVPRGFSATVANAGIFPGFIDKFPHGRTVAVPSDTEATGSHRILFEIPGKS